MRFIKDFKFRTLIVALFALYGVLQIRETIAGGAVMLTPPTGQGSTVTVGTVNASNGNFAFIDAGYVRINTELTIPGTVASSIVSSIPGGAQKAIQLDADDWIVMDGASNNAHIRYFPGPAAVGFSNAAGTHAITMVPASGAVGITDTLDVQGAGGASMVAALARGSTHLFVEGTNANSASNYGVILSNVTSFTQGTDRYIAGFSPDNAATKVARVDSNGQVEAQVGTSGTLAPLQGTLSVNTTGVGNVGASGPDDLQTYTLAANSLVTTGRCIKATAHGTLGNNTNSKTVRMTIGSTPTVLITKVEGALAVATGTWSIECKICRTGSNAQDYWCRASNNEGTTVSGTDGTTVEFAETFGTLTFTETASQDIKTQSTVSTSNNDIVSEMLIIEAM